MQREALITLQRTLISFLSLLSLAAALTISLTHLFQSFKTLSDSGLIGSLHRVRQFGIMMRHQPVTVPFISDQTCVGEPLKLRGAVSAKPNALEVAQY
jgi:hypothetical protein